MTSLPDKPWAIHGDAEDENRLITSINLEPEILEKHNIHLQEKYARITEAEIRYEDYLIDDAEMVIIGYGVVSRILQTVVDDLRSQGKKVGMMRPISLWPFPSAHIDALGDRVKKFLVVEFSNGQMVDDVRLALNGKTPVHFYNRMGGMVPSPEEIAVRPGAESFGGMSDGRESSG